MLTQPSLMISIMNGRRLGDGFIMAPDAELDDDLFDLCIDGRHLEVELLPRQIEIVCPPPGGVSCP